MRVMRDGVSYVNLHRPRQRGRCGSSGFLPYPAQSEQSLAVVTVRRGEGEDPAAAGGPLHTLRAVPSPIGAKEVLEVLQSAGLAPPE